MDELYGGGSAGARRKRRSRATKRRKRKTFGGGGFRYVASEGGGIGRKANGSLFLQWRRIAPARRASGAIVSIQAAMAASQTIPIVFTTGVDPVSTGFVASLGRPGHNVTGVSLLSAELAGKRLEVLSELVPKARVFAILSNPKNPAD